MNYFNTLFVCLFLCTILNGQVFYSENFDIYSTGVGISTVSADWEIVVQDAVISSERSTTGSNSLFFNESKDVNLILDDTYDSGTFTFSCQVYINFLSTNPQDFAGFYLGFEDSDQFSSFRNLSHLRHEKLIYNYDPFEEDRGAYTRIPDIEGRWFNYEVEIDLSNNVWNYYIDGICISSITNTNPSIAKCLFWGNTVEVWIDNVEYTHDPIPVNNSYTNDAAINYGQYQYHGIAGEPFLELGQVTNNGSSVINSLNLRFEYGDETFDVSLNNMNLQSGETMSIVPDIDILYKEGKLESALKVISVNGAEDELECNNAFSYYAVGYIIHPDKKVLVEVAVGTWCGLCLQNVYYKDLLESQYPGKVVGVEFHTDDVMENEDYLLNSFTSGGNDFKLDHSSPPVVSGTIGGYAYQELFMIRLASPPSALLDISGTMLADRTVEFSIDIEALQPILDVREIFIMVKEKSVTGTTPDYDQDNSFYSGNEVYPFGGFELLPPVIPSQEMEYSDVPRVLLTNIKGDRLLQNDLAVGDIANIKLEHTFDQDIDFEDLSVVVAIMDRNDYASNSEEASFVELGLVQDDLDGDGYNSDVDCDDNNHDIFPGAPELCNNIDDNCNGSIDEGLTVVTYYLDNDNDGFGDDNNSIDACMMPAGYVELGGDCDDNNPDVHPGAVELCNNVDDNCNGTIDESLTVVTYYLDNDNDGFGDDNNSIDACMMPDGYVEVDGDCDNNNPDVHPGAVELCNNIDDNCNGTIDESLTVVTYYLDNDNDGFGDDNNSIDACMMPDGYVEVGGDCDDNNPDINPNAIEIADNEIDENCDGDDLTTSTQSLSDNPIIIYPNPVTDILFIDYSDIDHTRITIYNAAGKLVLLSMKTSMISVDELDAGIYLLTVEDMRSGFKFLEKIVVY